MRKVKIEFSGKWPSQGKDISRRSLLAAVGAGAATLMAPVAWSKEELGWPSKMLRLIVTAPPGGVSDTIARILAEQMAIDLKQSVVVENISGGSGSIGSRAALAAPADGHTLMLTTNAVLVEVPHSIKLSYNPVQEFAQVADLVRLPLVLVGNPSLPAQTYDELLSLLKTNPGKFSVTTVGVGTRGHNATIIFNHQTGVDLQPVAYRGSPPAVADVLAGHVPLAFDALPNVISHVQSGRLRIYATGSPTRLSSFPDVPTLAEKGISDISQLASMQGVWISAATPRPLIQRIHEAVVKSFDSSRARQLFTDKGYEFSSPATLEQQNKELVDAFNQTAKIFKAYSIQAN